MTGTWLLGTAARHGGKLRTFAAGISSLLATQAARPAHVEVLGA